MAQEDFTTYTEVDPNTRVTKTATYVSWASIVRDEVAYVYKDKGVDYFDGDFTHLLTVKAIAVGNGMAAFHWVIANDIGTYKAIYDADGSELCLYFSGVTATISLTICEMDSGKSYGDSYTADRAVIEGTVYYLKIIRDESVGTYGTLYCYIYSDAARTTLVDTLSVTLHSSKKDFRYLYAFQGYGQTADTATASGYTETLALAAAATPSVTTQAMSDIVTTTATGNGNVTGLGTPSATQHGHCWNTTGIPTTSDDKTENGVPSATGAFTSSLTGLTVATKYYVRAYATNDAGTSYGEQVIFIAGAIGPGEGAGVYAVVEERFHYVDAYGTERYMEGTPIQ